MRNGALGVALTSLLLAACKPNDGDKAASASATASAAPRAATTSTASAASASAAAVPSGPPTAVLGGADWKAVFTGAPPMKLATLSSGGQGTGVADDLTRTMAYPAGDPTKWDKNATQVGENYTSPKKKVVIVTNGNQKTDSDAKTVELWSKSALVKDFKSTGGPEIVEIGPSKALALAGAGTCTMKDGGAADVYWFDADSEGDFAHDLYIVIVAKDAPEDEKSVALSILRSLEYNGKHKPHFKKP